MNTQHNHSPLTGPKNHAVATRRLLGQAPGIQIEIARRHYRGDPRLPIVDIHVRKAA